MGKKATAGNKGKNIRSDCFVTLEITAGGGLKIDVQSKVKILFGSKITALAEDVLSFFGIEHAELTIEDSGALPCVQAARIEAAVKQSLDTDREYLFDIIPENKSTTTRERNRRSRLYLPGNTPKLMINAGIHSPDGIILDLEDSVAPEKKAEARINVRNALRSINFYGAERMVRINQIPDGLVDLDYVIPHYVNLILVPKCESADQIEQVNHRIEQIRKDRKIDYQVFLMPIIESARGVINSFEIASSADNIAALAIGLEDYTADLGTQRTSEGKETYFARCQIVNSARAAGVQPIDSVFSDISDMEALARVVKESKSLGFDGMGCIHPRQIRVIHSNYAPDNEEIEKARRIVAAFRDAEAKGIGVVSLGTKMIDPPVVKRALKILKTAGIEGDEK